MELCIGVLCVLLQRLVTYQGEGGKWTSGAAVPGCRVQRAIK